MRRITILGAGLSGLTAAINLAKEGYEVEVYERNKDVAKRFRGDLEGLENWSERKDIVEELLEMNIEPNFDCDPFTHLVFTNGSITKEVNSEVPLFYLVKRGPFHGTIDYGLKLQALESGVNIHFGKTLPVSRVDIVATGPIPNEVPGIVKGITFNTEAEDMALVVFNDNLAFKGYSYLLITKGYGCLCSVVLREPRRIYECFEKAKTFFVKKFGLDVRKWKKVSGVGSFSFHNVFVKGTTLYVGEAAGLQDFFFGFGMRYAMVSGYLAAKSVIHNEDYWKLAETHFRNKLKASIVNRFLWEQVAFRRDYLFLVDLAEFAKNRLYSAYNYNLLQRILYPIALCYSKKNYPRLQ